MSCLVTAVLEITECFCSFLHIYHSNFDSRSFDDMLILAGEAPCPRAAVLPPGALLPDVAGRLPAGAGPLPRGDGAELHPQVCLVLNSII